MGASHQVVRQLREESNVRFIYLDENDFLRLVPRSSYKYVKNGNKYGYRPADITAVIERYTKYSKEDWEAYAAEKVEFLKHLREHARSCKIRAREASSKRSAERAGLQSSRFDAIKQRLVTLGWGKELTYYNYELGELNLVKQPRALTEQIWDRIREPLLTWIKQYRASRLRRSRGRALIKLYTSYVKSMGPLSLGLPTPRQLATLGEFQVAMTLDSDDTGEEIFEKAMSTLPEAINSWRNSVSDSLIAQLPSSSDATPESPESVLSLATSVFCAASAYLKIEPEILYYPSVLPHRSITDKPTRIAVRQDLPLRPWEGLNPWERNEDVEGIKYDELGASVIKCLLEECGLDPTTTTPGDLDNSDARFNCLVCKPVSDSRGMHWRRAIYHAHNIQVNDIDNPINILHNKFRRLSPPKRHTSLTWRSCEKNYDQPHLRSARQQTTSSSSGAVTTADSSIDTRPFTIRQISSNT
ncbi:hypothetical protein BOTBODRAFT_569265 [Botryobasidium botryosum FD-172 SS1]|uniref:Uncharacterized protein n=1 Tax=Botryobasidium botryosum (strain FD-172 SS1) TaxID=930990 RepID=A0A067LY93_BOTB1|nr:hypothetical protein BOTBODRAFT_569265 [Botryobasidium botryosum FD-172 SS1]